MEMILLWLYSFLAWIMKTIIKFKNIHGIRRHYKKCNICYDELRLVVFKY